MAVCTAGLQTGATIGDASVPAAEATHRECAEPCDVTAAETSGESEACAIGMPPAPPAKKMRNTGTHVSFGTSDVFEYAAGTSDRDGAAEGHGLPAAQVLLSGTEPAPLPAPGPPTSSFGGEPIAAAVDFDGIEIIDKILQKLTARVVDLRRAGRPSETERCGQAVLDALRRIRDRFGASGLPVPGPLMVQILHEDAKGMLEAACAMCGAREIAEIIGRV